MTTEAASATDNAALSDHKTSYIPDAQSIISTKYGSLQSALVAILRNQLTPKVNEGRLVYFGIATKVLDADSVNYSVSTDFWRRPDYAVQKEDGLADVDLSSKKIVFVHVPGLFTSVSNFDYKEGEESKKITPADLLKLPIATSLKIEKGDIIEVLFNSPHDYSNAKIVSALDKNDRRLKIQSKRKDGVSPLKAMGDFAKCKLLQVTGSSGGALDNRVFLNSAAPSTGYFGTYLKAAQNYLPSSNLLPPTVELMGKTAFTQTLLYPSEMGLLNKKSIKDATSEKNISVGLSFYTPDLQVGVRVLERLTLPELKDMSQFSKEIPFKFDPEMLVGFNSLETSADGDNVMNRSTYLLIEIKDIPEPSIFKQGQEDKFLDATTAYLTSVFKNEFKFGAKPRKITADEAKKNNFAKNCKFLQLDMMTNVEEGVGTATIPTALEFDALAFKKNFPKDASGNVAFSPLLEKEKGSTKSSTTFDDQVVGLKNPLDDCEDKDELLKDLYITAKGTDALRAANKRIKKLHALYKKIVAKPSDYSFVSNSLLPEEGASSLKLLNTSAQFVLLLDLIEYFAKSPHRTVWGRPQTTSAYRSRFTYTVTGAEEMSFPPELVKPQKKKPKGKPKRLPILPRGTSRNVMLGKSEKLALFYEELKKLIAGNESTAKNRVVPEQIVIVPLRVFRPYRPVRGKKPGHDRNSRHFYNRAIDFSVFIINNKNANQVNDLQEIPSDDVFQIPSDIVYLYVLRLMQLKNNFKGGLALFTRSENKKFSYNHYEYMQDVTSLQEVAKTRRWCNPPKKSEKRLLIGELFYSKDESKDDIVKNWVSNNYVSETLGGLPQKIQFLVE